MSSPLPPPWSRFFLYPQTVQSLSQTFQWAANEHKHEYEDEERTLHEYRNRIQVYESQLPPGRNWEYYKKAVNPYEWVYTQKKYDGFPDSICLLRPLSRSYFKMVEMLSLMGFFDAPPHPVRSAHVCEGPGGFIEALYDECAKRQWKCHSATAMTLKSHQTHVPGWRKASAFLRKNRTVEILYGEDGTGDIMKPENQQAFIDHITQKVDLFTADGGFDVSYDYEKQEVLVFPLLVASVKMGLEVLKKGGVFLLKVFDFYHCGTVDLLYFLSCHFQEWTLYKPSMSRPCNPEHYFMGKGFTGCTDEVLDTMRIWCLLLESHQPLNRLFQEGYSHDPAFLAYIEQQRTFSYRSQLHYLGRVFERIDREQVHLHTQQTMDVSENERQSYEWCVRFDVPRCARPLTSSPPSPGVGESQNDRPVSCPRPPTPDVEKDVLPPSGLAS